MVSPIDLLKKSLDLFLKYFAYLLLFWLIQLALDFLAVVPFTIFIVFGVMRSAVGLKFNPTLLIPLFIFSIVFIVLNVWLSAASLVQRNAVSLGRKIPFRNLFSLGWQKAGRLFVACLFSGGIILFGMVLFIIPGLIFSVWYTFVAPVVIAEDVNAAQALGRSKALVKGRFWTVVKYMIFPILVSILYSFVTSVALGPLPWAKPIASLLYLPLGIIFAVYSFQVYYVFRDHPVVP